MSGREESWRCSCGYNEGNAGGWQEWIGTCQGNSGNECLLHEGGREAVVGGPRERLYYTTRESGTQVLKSRRQGLLTRQWGQCLGQACLHSFLNALNDVFPLWGVHIE